MKYIETLPSSLERGSVKALNITIKVLGLNWKE